MTCRSCGAEAAPTDALCLECGEHLLRHTPMPPLRALSSTPSLKSPREPAPAPSETTARPSPPPPNSRGLPTPVLSESGPLAAIAMPFAFAATDDPSGLGGHEPWGPRSHEHAPHFDVERLERAAEITPRDDAHAPIAEPPAPSVRLGVAGESAAPIAPRRAPPKRRGEDDEGARCPGCGTLFPSEPSRCRVCGAPFRPLR